MFKNSFFAIAIIVLFFTCLNACKESAVLGRNLVPIVDNVNTFQSDTFTVISNNIYSDSIFQNQVATSGIAFPALGTIANDPVVGSTIASVFFQVRQPKALFTLTTDSASTVADSLVLSIPFSLNYGDTNVNTCQLQTINAYRLTDSLPKDSVYYNSSFKNYNPSLLGSCTVNFAKHSINDSITLPEGKVPAQLRIKFSQTFADSLLRLYSNGEYSTYAIFTNWLKGFYLTPADTTNGNSIGYLNIASAKMRLYTHGKLGTNLDSAVAYDFPIDNTVNAHFNRITKNYNVNNPQIKNYLNTGNTNGDSLLFTQGNIGSAIVLTMPYLANFPNAVINKADFEFTQVASAYPGSDSLYWPPARLKAIGIDQNGKDYTLTADYLDDANYPMAGGIRSTDSSTGLPIIKYKVNLAHFIQKLIITKNNKLKLKIVASNGQIASGRTVLGGSSNTFKKMKLNIIYTKIK